MTYPFIQAKGFTRGRLGAAVRLVVVHDMEYPEKPTGAEWCARYFAGPTAPAASAHYCVDSDSIVQCVDETDTAWAAPGANRDGIHIEHAGYARQSADEWADPFSEAMLHRSAALTADICKRHDIPIRRLTVAEVTSGERGICGHIDVTDAFHKGDHRDPGEHFPWAHYLDLVTEAAGSA